MFVLQSTAPVNEEQVDDQIEQWLKQTFSIDIDFEVDDALEKLEKMNISVNHDSRNNSSSTRVGKGPGYEFQFLLGVRGNLRRKLASEGHLTRVYVPYGTKWYEYGVRRIRENPDIAWHVTKTIIMPWTNRK